eukprot:1754099-Pleurochrysis_carterae.AAC.1
MCARARARTCAGVHEREASGALLCPRSQTRESANAHERGRSGARTRTLSWARVLEDASVAMYACVHSHTHFMKTSRRKKRERKENLHKTHPAHPP